MDVINAELRIVLFGPDVLICSLKTNISARFLTPYRYIRDI